MGQPAHDRRQGRPGHCHGPYIPSWPEGRPLRRSLGSAQRSPMLVLPISFSFGDAN